jgi:hypothetical protein
MMNHAHSRPSVFVLAATLCVGAGLFAFAGDLEPPGAPAPTMKTLDEVEPRTPIRAADLPLTIMSAGSYYLTENVEVAGNGIVVSSAGDAGQVTIDLMGYTLSGGTGAGILCGNPTKNITIRNGTVSGFGQYGIGCGSATNLVVENVRADSNDGIGIDAGMHAVIRRCTAIDNGMDGFQIRGESVVTDNLAVGNGSLAVIGSGIVVVGNGSRIEGNHLLQNDRGIYDAGLNPADNIVIRNTAGGNPLNYQISTTDNEVGPVGGASSTSPFANLETTP